MSTLAQPSDDEREEHVRITAPPDKHSCYATPVHLLSLARSRQQVIYVTVRDFSDKGDVLEVGKYITGDLNESMRAGFKPDIFSDLNVKSGNEWGLDSVIYKDLRDEINTYGTNVNSG